MTESSRQIETPAGVLWGRDTIFLEEFRVDEHLTEVWLRVEIVGSHGTRPIDEDIRCLIHFKQVLASMVVELECSRAYGFEGVFGEVIDSRWVPRWHTATSSRPVIGTTSSRPTTTGSKWSQRHATCV